MCTTRSIILGPASCLNVGVLRIVPSLGPTATYHSGVEGVGPTATYHSGVEGVGCLGRKTFLDGTIDRSGHRGSFNYLDGDP